MIKNKRVKLTIATLTSCIALTSTVLASGLKDIENHWAKQYIDNLTTKKVITGYPDGTFKPSSNITREEVSNLLSNYIGAKEVENDKLSDIEGRWSTKAIKHLVSEGIITGYPDSTFKPSKDVTRAEFATMVYKHLKKENKLTQGNLNKLSDIQSHWAKQSIEGIANSGAIKGYPDGTFKPNNNITRAEVSTVVSLIDGFKPVEEKPVEPPVEENKIKIEDMKEEEYQNGSNYDLKVYDPKDVLRDDIYHGNTKFTDFYSGVIKMKFPSHYNFELKDIKSQGKLYTQLHCEGFRYKDGFGIYGGSLLSKDGEKLGLITGTGDNTFSVGLKENNLIEKAEYIAFQKDANDYMKDPKASKQVLVIFENPFIK